MSDENTSFDAGLREIDALLAGGDLFRNRERIPQRSKASAERKRRAGKSAASSESGARRGPKILTIPEWKQYGWLIHGFSTRPGGVSRAYRPDSSCGELNLGLTPGDSPENVEANRKLFLKAVLAASAGGESGSKTGRMRKRSPDGSLQLLQQIHSGMVHHLAGGEEKLRRGDGAIATEPGVVLGIQTADCIPVLVADVRQRIVGAFHAGWRGTLARVAERGVGRMRAEFGSRAGDLTAAIGPGVGRCCYSVGEDVRSQFESQFAYADSLFEEVFDLDPIKEKYPMLFLTARPPGHSNLGPSLHLDLVEANRLQLLDAGLSEKSIHVLGICTSCDTKRFFSYRAEHGYTGRMISAIGVRV